MSKEIILIGGSFHRERRRIEEHQCVIRIPLPIEIRAKALLEMQYEELKYEEYKQLHSLFGEVGIIPPNVFLHESLNPVTFLKNLVLDYTR